MDSLPEEILRYVLLKLPVKTMVRCRQVCKVWKNVVDECTKSDEFWKGRCAAEYSEIYLEAKRKALPSLTWQELYKSMSAWSNFDESRVGVEWKAPFCVVGVESGLVVLRKDKILKVVDVNKKKVDRNWALYGYIFKYYENENFIAVMRDHCDRPSLEIFVKEGNKVTDKRFEIEFVKDCICVNNTIYYAKYDRGVCRYDFNGNEPCPYDTNHDLNENEHKLLFEVVDVGNVIAMTHKNNNVMVIHRRTEDSNIIVYNEETAMVTRQILLPNEDIFQMLVDHDFTKHMVEENWADINKTMGNHLRETYRTLKQHSSGFYIITSFKQYGDTVFVGSDMGYFFVFRNPYRNGKIDFNTKPVMLFRKRGHVYYIDVIESKSGPTLIVSMDENVFALKLRYGTETEKNTATKSASSSTRCAGAKRQRMQ